jgi:peptidoglycan/LPS O-acetylase OafA/YrhL
MTELTAKRPHYPALDGLRGFASLLVVIYHNFGFINNYFFFGWLGLDIFFALSGFLITDILINTVAHKNFLRNFYGRRILRVFPVYYLGLIIFLIVLPGIGSFPFKFDYYIDHQLWFWTYLQNWLFIFHPPTNESSLNHLWSLAVEEQFYLLWPLGVLVLRKPKYLLTFILLILMLTIGLRWWIWTKHIAGFAYYNLYTFTRIDGICIGCSIALLQKINFRFLENHTSTLIFSFAGLNFLFYLLNLRYNDSLPYLAIIGYTTFALIFGLLIYDIVNIGTKFYRFIFNISILNLVGRISYGCYIIHWPLYLMIGPYLKKFAEQHISDRFANFFASAVATLLAYVLGYLSYQYFETKFLRLKNHFV